LHLDAIDFHSVAQAEIERQRAFGKRHTLHSICGLSSRADSMSPEGKHRQRADQWLASFEHSNERTDSTQCPDVPERRLPRAKLTFE
jgi:hypothetical protein